VELTEGAGERLMGGQVTPYTLLLPKFGKLDLELTPLLRRWRPFGRRHPLNSLIRPLVRLSAGCQELLTATADTAPLGLDIEFAIKGRRIYFLQARPITTPEEAEEVLTSANHKEILPPHPSQLMTDVIASCSRHLFAYYQRLDPALEQRSFIQVSAGMPWINLSALLDMMTAWGLPTSLVADTVGAQDPYRVKTRPWRWIRKWPVFVRVLKEQFTVVGRTRRWVRHTQRALLRETESRRKLWYQTPDIAFTNWFTDLQFLYVELVTLMQALVGAMSGPVKLISKLGMLPHIASQSESTRYLEAFRDMQAGRISREAFLERYGHRGFYESDIGQKRFHEFGPAEWEALLHRAGPPAAAAAEPLRPRRLLRPLYQPFFRIMRTREWLRHHAMRYFDLLRAEIQLQTQNRLGPDFDFSRYPAQVLNEALAGRVSAEALSAMPPARQSGWDYDAFLRNGADRRLPLSVLTGLGREDAAPKGIGIYPGRVQGYIWQVDRAEVESLQRPDFPSVILLTESLDPGWAPYFVQVQGVIAYVGGLLSHASIVLRESSIPSITQAPREPVLRHGDLVELDGRTGEIWLLQAAADR
jgi:pyruvate,water dikinase